MTNTDSKEQNEKKSHNSTLGRRLSRRLSLVTKVPSIINAKLKHDVFSSSTPDFFVMDKKSFDLIAIAPDKTQRIVPCSVGQTIMEAITPILQEFSIDQPKLYLGGSQAIVEPEADCAFLYDNVLIIDRGEPTDEFDGANMNFFKLHEKIMNEESEYVKILLSAAELYDNPVPSTTNSICDLSIIFQSLNNLAAVCSEVVNELASTLLLGNNSFFDVCCVFNDKLWEEYDNYLLNYRTFKRLIRQKKNEDENFVHICRLRQGAAKYSLEQIIDFPVQRLSEYERYFESLLAESRLDQCNIEEINKAKTKCKQAAKRGQRESDLERIQDLFPNDCLRLYDADALTMKVKGLMRKRSGAAARLQRALSTKSLRSESPSQKTPLSGSEQRTFLMEAPVQFSTGVQSQDRHLFLFNDLLLIAKARSGGNFKLKEKVRISEIWLTKCCLDDVSELNKSEDTSFVMGWPTTNLVVTFSTQAARDLWWNKLLEVFRTENEKEPCSTNIQVMYYDASTNIEYFKTFSVGPEETARDCIKLALEHLEMRHLDHSHFQLWAKTARDESPYPLIGHERPFAIKLSCLRDSLSSEDGFDLDHCNNIHDPVARCHFILRNSVKNPVLENKKNNKKSSTRGMKIGHVFRRSLSKDQSASLFGIPLCKLTDGEILPKPIMNMLYQVFAKGPFMQGIFRKSANARLVRELRDKLDAGEDVTWEHVPVLVTAALLKDFLRSLPEPLLGSTLYPQWRAALEAPNLNTKLYRMKGVLSQLPKPNHLLLIHFLCVLYHIARRSCHTLMSAANLGVCVGPSLLWSDCPNVGDDLRVVPAVVECLITHCEFLCGSHVTSLLGDLRDSGTEESDSMKRDDSSIDSLECSPPPRKDKMSLSRDSGLTMSDSQLYTPDEEESGSTSSSGYDPAFESHAKVSPSISMPTNYVRVYGGWEERLNPNYFQRQAWFRQRSRRMNSTSSTKNDVRRSASEESLLDSSAPPPTPPRRNKGHDYEQTPAYPRKNAVIIPRRIEVASKNSENEARNGIDGDTSSYAIVNYGKESNSTGVPKMERRSLPNPQPAFTSKCDNVANVRPMENHYTNVCVNSTPSPDKTVATFGTGDYYYAVREQIEDVKNSECEDSSTLSDEDCTPHVSRSNSRGNEVVTKLKYSPAAVHSETCVVRGRVKKKEDRVAHRSRSLPPPPPYRPPPPATSRRAPITSYYLGDCNQIQKYVITRTYMDEESYV